jgi:hypothetical protein
MAEDNKNVYPAFVAPPEYSTVQYPYVMQNGVPVQPVFFAPQGSVNSDPVKQPLIPQEPAKQGCKRWGWVCRQSKGTEEGGKCCMKDDGRPLGNLTNFFQGVSLGSIAPFFALIGMYGFETSKLNRTGAWFGTANFFLTAGLAISAASHHWDHECSGKASVFFMIVGLISLIIAVKSFKWFLWTFNTRQNKTEHEVVKVISTVGTSCGFAVSFLISLIFPFIGAMLMLVVGRKQLKMRYGALVGLSFYMILSGSVMSIFHGIPPFEFLFGMLLVEMSMVHFKRAIMCAEAQATPVSNC